MIRFCRIQSHTLVCTGLLAGLSMFAGCSAVPVTSTARRDASFARLHDASVGNVPLRDHMAARTAFVLVGDEIFDERQSSEAGGQSIQFSVSSKIEFGSATMIDERGYLLTAAHVVDKAPVTVIYYNDGVIQHQKARLVWNGFTEPDKPDLALLRVALPQPAAFRWATHFETNDDVAAVGLNYSGTRKLMSFIGGKIGPDRPFFKTRTTQTITSDLPLHFGDSGGPLVDIHGELIAINIRVTLSRLEYLGIRRKIRSDAIRPDLAWLRQLIEQNYAGP